MRRRVIAQANLPAPFPFGFACAVWLMLEHYTAPRWTFVVFWFAVGAVFAGCAIRSLCSEHVDVLDRITRRVP